MGCAQIIRWAALAILLGVGCRTPQPESRSDLSYGDESDVKAGAKAPPPKGTPQPRVRLPKTFYIVHQVHHEGTQPGSNRLVTTYQLHFEYPEFQHPGFSGLNQVVLDLVGDRRVRMMDLAGFLDENTLASPSLPWQATLTFKIAWATNDFISLRFEHYEFTGGTNGHTTLATINYDAQLGECLSLDYCLASPAALQGLSNKVRQRLKENLKEKADEARLEQGARPSWENYQCFTLTRTHLVLHFSPGQVAPPDTGIQQVELAWDEISALLNPDFLAFLEQIEKPPKPR